MKQLIVYLPIEECEDCGATVDPDAAQVMIVLACPHCGELQLYRPQEDDKLPSPSGIALSPG